MKTLAQLTFDYLWLFIFENEKDAQERLLADPDEHGYIPPSPFPGH